MAKEEMIFVGASVPKGIKEKLERLAKAERRSLSKQVLIAIVEHLEKNNASR